MHTKLKTIAPLNAKNPKKTWRLTSLAGTMGVLLGMVHADANALALGRVAAMSALGEPFIAHIDVPDINDEERASLKATLASPDAFRVAGMEYNPALASTQVTLMRRDNGSSYLLLRSDKIVTDPFVSLVINANWSNGRIVRNYTLLLDPPAAKQAEATAVTAPIAVLAAPTRAPASVATPAATPVIAAPAAASQTPAPAPARASVLPKAPETTKPSAVTPSSTEQVKVNNGDTAGKIAATNLPATVSLEQMLAAMLRGNPKAFIGNNINRLKAGVILDIPTEAQAAAISTKEAHQNLTAQSKDFNSFRRKLAENAPTLASKANDRVASGKIDAKVEDQKTAAIAPDKLTLSKGGLTAGDKSAMVAVEKVAKERQAKEDAERTAERVKNTKDLNNIASAIPAAQTTLNNTAPNATAAVTNATTPQKTETPAAPAPAPAPTTIAKAAVVTPPVETSFIDDLMGSDWVKPLAGALLTALVGGALFFNHQRKQRKMAQDAEDAEDELRHEGDAEKSFFNDTSNEPVMAQDIPIVETEFQDAPVAITHLTTAAEVSDIALPKVNAHKNVDPLTEANVYLDYGRDMQAEEILKDGLKTQPGNTAIYSKLMDIYAKRRDAKSFELMALSAKPLFKESGAEWLAICKKGFDLEPSNPLYRDAASQIGTSSDTVSSAEFSPPTFAQLNPVLSKSPASVDLDLDFNFASSFPDSIPAKKMDTHKAPLVEFTDFSLEPVKVAAPATSIANKMTQPAELGLDHLSLDLNGATSREKTESAIDVHSNVPLETKLALAQEFRSIGDTVGARMLANEVLSLATGSLKTRAETLLSEIG